MLLRMSPMRQTIRLLTHNYHKVSTVYVNGSSFIKLSTDFPTIQALTKTDVLTETPFVSNNFDNFLADWQFSHKVVGTRIRLNLSDRQLKLDPTVLKNHPAIKQIAVNASLVNSTGQSRLIVDSPVEQDPQTRTKFNDPYRTFRDNMQYVEKTLQGVANCQVSFLIDRDNYDNVELKKMLTHKKKALDFNIIQAANSQKVLLDSLFQDAYRLEHVYLRSYVKDPANMKFNEVKDLSSTQVTLSEVVNILKINSFKGALVLPFSAEHFKKNLDVATQVLRDHAFTQRTEGGMNDNWIVF